MQANTKLTADRYSN